MTEVRLTKAFRVFPDRPLVKPGTPVDVDEATYQRLVGLGLVDAPEVTGGSDDAPPVGDDEEASSTPDGEDAPKEEPKTTSMPTAEYPPLPDRTATVAVWKEYARANGIKLTGLSKRAEIIGFVEKVAGRGE